MVNEDSAAWITQLLALMGGCLGLCESKIHGQLVRKSSISEGFWSTSTYDLESSTIMPQRSMTSITIPNLSLTQYSGTGNTITHEEFVNQGYLWWKQNRLQWRGSKKTENRRLVWKSILDWDASYECTAETSKPFPCPIPLSEMVDLLVDTWEEDGLYYE
ncbi:PREDICTED: uncharacterized protein LOC109156360 [Ipomoea nil]|uniref:uncharacterized protein LOC109156360 n=1 Tax=Ipomoea nil TaxID=35883 RepID=UPI0009013D92|nr:PREDICTED: uncharacterized protein LOC109156360 [Ipomoea nil]